MLRTVTAVAVMAVAAGALAVPADARTVSAGHQRFTVDSRAEKGTRSPEPLRAGGRYRITVTGTYDYDTARPGAQHADAECSTSSPLERPVAPTGGVGWQRFRYLLGPDPAARTARRGLERDTLDVTVAGLPAEWNALDTVDTCSATHQYETVHVAASDGPVVVAVDDIYHGDNRGALTVEVAPLR